jgi:hypothetical protein
MNRKALLALIAITLLLLACGWHHTVTVAGVPVANLSGLRLILGLEFMALAFIGRGIARSLGWRTVAP